MPASIVTSEDLEFFRRSLVEEFKRIVATLRSPSEPTGWLNQQEACKLIGVSVSKLQRLRVSGQIAGKKVGRQYYYKRTDIEKLMSHESNRFIPQLLQKDDR